MSGKSPRLGSPGHIGIDHPHILHDSDIVDATYPGNMREQTNIILVGAVDKQAPYLISLPVEAPGKPVIICSNWLPSPSLVGCPTGQLHVAGSSRIEIVHQNIGATKIISDGIQIIPVPYFDRTGSTGYRNGS